MRMFWMIVFAVIAMGCNLGTQSSASSSEPQVTAAMASASQMAQRPGGNVAFSDVSGKVLEILTAPGYLYLRLETTSGEKWAAIETAPVKVGDSVVITGAAPMDGFESKTLGRKFDQIVFGALATQGDNSAMAEAALAVVGNKAHPTQHQAATAANIKVARADGDNSRTVGELFANKAADNGKSVVVRGQVVKFSANIMGKNWVHIQDGSGEAAKNSHDLTVTTKDAVAVGDIVLVKGKVKAGVDVGAGYTYPVMIDMGSVTTE